MSDEIEVNENQTAIIEEPAVKTEGMSNRDALERAISEKREVRPGQEETQTGLPTKAEVKEAVQDSPEPPSEFSAVGKKAWIDKDISGIQKEFRRIHDDRTKELSRAQTSERQTLERVKPWLRIGEVAEPYIKAQGDLGASPEQAIMNSLALTNALKTGKRSEIKAALKEQGIDLDVPDEDGNKIENSVIKELKDQFSALQDSHNALLSEREARVFEQTRSVFTDSISKLADLKNRTGDPVFPMFYDSSDKGKQFAADLGSRTKDPKFQQWVRDRFPDADHMILVREAYKSLGGQVSGEPVQVSVNDKKHIEKSRRAAASTPGRVVARSDSSNLVGKLSNRAALARAYSESQEH